MKNLDLLCNSIWNELPYLVYDDEFEQFDEGSGFRLTHKMKIPEPPSLNDVLKWHSSKDRNKYSHFEVSKGIGYFVIYDSDESYVINWDLSKGLLHEQSDELIDWLSDLI